MLRTCAQIGWLRDFEILRSGSGSLTHVSHQTQTFLFAQQGAGDPKGSFPGSVSIQTKSRKQVDLNQAVTTVFHQTMATVC